MIAAGSDEDPVHVPRTTLLALEETIAERRRAAESGAGDKPSWTAKLIQDPELCCKKIREEASELCQTWEAEEGRERTVSEVRGKRGRGAPSQCLHVDQPPVTERTCHHCCHHLCTWISHPRQPCHHCRCVPRQQLSDRFADGGPAVPLDGAAQCARCIDGRGTRRAPWPLRSVWHRRKGVTQGQVTVA